MATSNDDLNLALFCDFENVALGVRDAKYDRFDINRVLERLLLKGSIVVKKAYCDWERYKEFKAPMHGASFELIEIPHVRQSGKNSADIRMVVDALDLCYTKSHVDTFVIISGDSDFSPLVSKLRENNKTVIGVGVKSSTSDLLINNCDEFIFYDDLVRDQARRRRAPARRKAPSTPEGGKPEAGSRSEGPAKEPSRGRGRRSRGRGRDAEAQAPVASGDETFELREPPYDAGSGGDAPPWGESRFDADDASPAGMDDDYAGYRGDADAREGGSGGDAEARGDVDSRGEGDARGDDTPSDKQQEAFDLVMETLDALIAERGAGELVWGSMIKQTLKRRKPGFNEGYYGFRSFNALLEEAQAQNLVQLERDQKSGGYLVRPVAA
jgi:uncharacterized LabA/DUF88 family protein